MRKRRVLCFISIFSAFCFVCAESEVIAEVASKIISIDNNSVVTALADDGKFQSDKGVDMTMNKNETQSNNRRKLKGSDPFLELMDNSSVLELIKLSITPVIVAILILIAQFFLQPIIQAKITSKSELWLQKKDVFSRSIVLVARQFDSSNISGSLAERHIPIKEKPTSTEKNEILSQLYLISKNENIPKKFLEVIDRDTNPAEISKYIVLLREELYGSGINLNPETEMGLFLNIDPVE